MYDSSIETTRANEEATTNKHHVKEASQIDHEARRVVWRAIRPRLLYKGPTSQRSSEFRGLSDPDTDEMTASIRNLLPSNDDGSSSMSSTSSSDSCASSGCLKIRTQSESLDRLFGSGRRGVCSYVTWAEIELKTYEVILGDNPSVTTGPPVQLGWDVLETQRLSLEDYERFRGPRRVKGELILPRMERELILMEVGHPRSDLKRASDRALAIRRQREASCIPSAWERIFHRYSPAQGTSSNGKD